MKARNKQFDIILAIGIVFVLMGHSHQPAYLFYPAYCFHMGLFFFVSGYFFTPRISLKKKASFIVKKISTQLLPYFGLLVFFGILTQLLREYGINLGGQITVNNLFWNCFERADQFHLYLSAWFLLTLFFVNVFVVAILVEDNRLNTLVFLVTMVLMFYALDKGRFHPGELSLQWIRGIFGVFFYLLGYFFRLYEARIQKLLLTPACMVALFVIEDALIFYYKNLGYSILLGDIGNDALWAPILSTIVILAMVYIVSYFVASITADNALILVIGRNTFAIMVWHFAGFFCLNLLLFAFGIIPFESLSDVYFRYKVDQTWLVYLIFGLFVPIVVSKSYAYLNYSMRRVLP